MLSACNGFPSTSFGLIYPIFRVKYDSVCNDIVTANLLKYDRTLVHNGVALCVNNGKNLFRLFVVCRWDVMYHVHGIEVC